MQQQFIEYHHAGTVLEGFLASPAKTGERRPAVLVSHAWAGRDDFVIDKAKFDAKMKEKAGKRG